MAKNIVFVSHCSADQEFSRRVFPHLENLERLLDVEVWTDVRDIHAGDEWAAKIDEALDQTCVAVMLVSPAFLNSEFIRSVEIPRLLKRRSSGLRVIPLQMMPAARPEWLKQTEMRPKGDKTLFEIYSASPAEFERHMAQIVEEMHGLLVGEVGEARQGPPVRFEGRPNAACVKLLCQTLLQSIGDAERYAEPLVGEIARLTGLRDEGLFNATRVFIEYHLLESEDPDSPAALELAAARGGKPPEDLVELLRQFGRTANPRDVRYEVLSGFFDRTRSREAEWKRYFDAVAEHGGQPRESIGSLIRIHAQMGYIAAQSLVAGLLARFGNEWRPVLDAYQSAIPSPRERNSAFESLQASQWNCWLMWGPSIPICTCEQWRGIFAFQYGYGDENNSLPALEIAADERAVPPRLDALGRELREERRGAKFSELSARLRWAPWFLKPYGDAVVEKEFNLAARNRRRQRQGLAKYAAAPAQVSLYHEGTGCGLALQLDEAEGPRPERETRVYFSAYYWLIFLVATPAVRGREAEGPALLRHKRYPDWDERESGIVNAQLWQDLLPVFVHANIGDPEALRFQKQVLVENAVQLLRDVWGRREQLFHPEDVAAGIRFHLACGSDYSGCGCPIRYAPQGSLVQALRARLGAEADRALAEAIALPPENETAETRPSGLAGYFSACHLPELIAGYYAHVARVSEGAD